MLQTRVKVPHSIDIVKGHGDNEVSVVKAADK